MQNWLSQLCSLTIVKQQTNNVNHYTTNLQLGHHNSARFVLTPTIAVLRFIFITLTFSSCCLAGKPFEVAFNTLGSCDDEGPGYARAHGCYYMGQVGTLNKYCYMKCHDLRSYQYSADRYRQGQRKARLAPTWSEIQKPLLRVKRGYQNEGQVFNDPEWKYMWYLNRKSRGSNLPDHNVSSVWKMGYTGRGVVLTFLDDGLEYTHPDLRVNYDPIASIDVNNNDPDPTPRYERTLTNRHGTRCAGEVAAAANNSMCVVGVAYNAKIGGIRMLDGDVSDRVEAASLSHEPNHIDIYSASWGPDDNGMVVDGPGPMTQRAFEQGAKHGRNGKGSIYIWASGNGGRDGDSCACDGYINSIYTLAISATTERGMKPWYHEECAGTLATTFSSGDAHRADGAIVTTDIQFSCTRQHTGTSAAAPLAAGFIALVLEARPELTWRDVMYICILGSRYDAIHDESMYTTNGAGFKVSSVYGFGLMDAGLMMHHALNWKLVDKMVSCEDGHKKEHKTINSRSTLETHFFYHACRHSENEIRYVEQVQVFVDLRCHERGAHSITIISPSGTSSNILPFRRMDHGKGNFDKWPFLTLHFWGENPFGVWTLKITNVNMTTSYLDSWWLRVHGTTQIGIRNPRDTSAATLTITWRYSTSVIVAILPIVIAKIIAAINRQQSENIGILFQ